jgi:hypothetical protein
MRIHTRIPWSVILALLVALGGLACDGGAERACGAGTVEQAGRCLPVITACGPGTVQQGATCVPACPAGEYWAGAACMAVPECAAGTVFYPAEAACRPACGLEQQWNGQACAPLCAPGTRFDPPSGECLPEPGVCGPGTHWEDGQCVGDLACGPGTHPQGGVCLPDRLPEPDVLESPDPSQAALVVLPAAGQAVRLGGVVDTPVDLNGDGYVDASWDAFAFEAPTGAWLRLSATSEGAALPAFIVQSEAQDAQGYALYARYVLDPVALPAGREVYLPRAGRYFLFVSDYRNMMVDVFGFGFLPVGGEEFSYQVLLENLGAPAPTLVDLPLEDEGLLERGELGFFTLRSLDVRDVLGLRSRAGADQGEDLLPAFLLFDPQGELLHEEIGGWSQDAARTLVVTRPGDYLLVQDSLVTIGPRTGYDLSAVREPVEDCVAATCQSGPLLAGQHRLWSYDLAAGDFFLFSGRLGGGTENLRVTLLDETFTVLSEASAGPSWERWGHLLAGRDTWVYLWLEGWSGGAVDDWSLDSVWFPVPALPASGQLAGVAVEPMPGLAFGDSGLVRFEAQAGQVVLVTDLQRHDPGGAWTQPAQDLADPKLVFLGPALDVLDPALARLEPALAWIPEDGTYLHRAFDLDPTVELVGASYDLGLARVVPGALGEPLAGAPVERLDQVLPADAGSLVLTLEAAQGASYQLEFTPQGGADLQLEVWVLAFGSHYQTSWYSRANGRELGRIRLVAAAAPGEALSFSLASPYAGRVVVLVRDARDPDPAPTGLFDLRISRN